MTRDLRSKSAIRASSGTSNSFENLFFKLYSSLSHKKIIARSEKKEKLNAKIISVGNITFGGSGKTPFTAYMAEHLTSKGITVGIASGGWRGSQRDVGNLVSDGSSLHADIESVGDEAIELAARLLDFHIPIFAHRNRIIAANELIDAFNCRVVIMDDAYHFTSVVKDADVLLINALNPFGGGSNLKIGVLREPPSAINRADAIIITNRKLIDEKQFNKLTDYIKSLSFEKPIFNSTYLPNRVQVPDGKNLAIDDVSGMSLLPVSGIGNPVAFEKSLSMIGIQFNEPIRFDDHHEFTSNDISFIRNAIKSDGAMGIITTPKDMARLRKSIPQLGFDVFVLYSEIVVDDDFPRWLELKTNPYVI